MKVTLQKFEDGSVAITADAEAAVKLAGQLQELVVGQMGIGKDQRSFADSVDTSICLALYHLRCSDHFAATRVLNELRGEVMKYAH